VARKNGFGQFILQQEDVVLIATGRVEVNWKRVMRNQLDFSQRYRFPVAEAKNADGFTPEADPEKARIILELSTKSGQGNF